MPKIPEEIVALCANFDPNHCICVDAENRVIFNQGECLVRNGKPCPYFKRTVVVQLSPEYKYSSYHENPTQCRKVLETYNTIDQDKKARQCSCGAILPYRRRMCNRCRDNNRRLTRRLSRRKANATIN